MPTTIASGTFSIAARKISGFCAAVSAVKRPLLQCLMAGELLQPAAAQRLGLGDHGRSAALHARDKVGLFSHSHKLMLLS
jgi:hypothetical protein